MTYQQLDSISNCVIQYNRILDSLAELTIKVDTLSTRATKCDEIGEETKWSVTECLQTCQESLEVSTQNRKEVKELK